MCAGEIPPKSISEKIPIVEFIGPTGLASAVAV
jgi:hypothetical protein